MTAVSALVVAALILLSSVAPRAAAQSECADATAAFMDMTLGPTRRRLVKAQRDAEELLREASWAERHNATISAEEKARGVAAAERERDEARAALAQYASLKGEPAQERLLVACGILAATATTRSGGLASAAAAPRGAFAEALENTAADVPHIFIEMLRGAWRVWWRRYAALIGKVVEFFERSAAGVRMKVSTPPAPDASTMQLPPQLLAAGYLIGPVLLATSLAMLLLVFAPVIVGYHFVCDFLHGVVLLGALNPLSNDYAARHSLNSVNEVLLHAAQANPEYFFAGGLLVVIVSVAAALVALPWTAPLISLVIAAPRRP